tara:strand:+ start:27 stop:518 length:492 start_codon:yes stop_codon:yes gene_type:complete
MKKLIISLIFLPLMAFAENVNKISINYVDIGGDVGGTDGYGFSFDSAMNDKVILQLDYIKLSGDGFVDDFNILSGAYAFGSLSEGSAYAGLARFDAGGGSADTEFEVGYARIGGDGPDFSVGLINSDDDLTFRGEIHTPSGVSLGILTDGDVDLINIGYHFKF